MLCLQHAAVVAYSAMSLLKDVMCSITSPIHVLASILFAGSSYHGSQVEEGFPDDDSRANSIGAGQPHAKKLCHTTVQPGTCCDVASTCVATVPYLCLLLSTVHDTVHGYITHEA